MQSHECSNENRNNRDSSIESKERTKLSVNNINKLNRMNGLAQNRQIEGQSEIRRALEDRTHPMNNSGKKKMK